MRFSVHGMRKAVNHKAQNKQYYTESGKRSGGGKESEFENVRANAQSEKANPFESPSSFGICEKVFIESSSHNLRF